MTAALRLIQDIDQAESSGRDFLVAYKDSRGFWTIGKGHLLQPYSKDWTGYTITKDQQTQLLAMDIGVAQSLAVTLPEWRSLDTECRQNAVIECVYNLGIDHWIKEFPKTRKAILEQRWTDAATNLLDSPEWIQEVGRARVARLAGYLRSGQYSPLPA